MSRQAGSIVRGISKPRRISVKRAGSRWRVCTAGAAQGQGRAQPAGDRLESAGNWIGYWKWNVKLIYTFARNTNGAAGGNFGEPAVEAPDPEWIDATQNSNNGNKLPQLKCP